MQWRWVGNFAVCIVVLAALVGLARYRQLSPAIRYVALLAIFTVALEATAYVFIAKKRPNLFLLPISLVGEGLLLTLAYRRILASPRLGRALLAGLAVYLTFLLAETLRNQGTIQYYVAAQVVSNVVLLGLAALYFRQLLHELRVEHLSQDPFFWLSTTLVIYAQGNLLIALSSDYLIAHCSLAAQQLVLHGMRNLFNILLYATYFTVIWMRPPKPSL